MVLLLPVHAQHKTPWIKGPVPVSYRYICSPRTLPDLTAIFERCTAVHAFTLVDVAKARYDGQAEDADVSYAHRSNDELIDVVRAHPHAFPRPASSSFKLVGARFWGDQIEAVAAFPQDKAPMLRRLDLVNDKWTGLDGDGIVDDWGPLFEFEILSGFPRLEVLGF